MTYAEIAEALRIGPDSARNLVRRKRWSRQTGNDGLARVGVPVEHLEKPKAADAPSGGPTDPPTDGATNAPIDGSTDAPTDGTIIAIGVLKEHIGRLEAEISSLRNERDRERARASQVDALTAILEIERKRVEELRAERDRWSAAAEAFQGQLVELTKPRGLFGRLFRTAG
jgi:hypothetical protein